MHSVRTLVAAVLLLVPGGVCFATDQDPCDAGASVSEVQFTLNLRGGQTQFREGEIIPLVLSFSTASSHYWLNTASYDRSGRLGIDTYCVDPEGTDPLGEYFRGGFIGGGLFTNLHLVEKPFTREAELNEWQRLRAGNYRFYVVSRRVSRASEAGEASETGEIGLSIRSNAIEFQVVPAEKDWQKEQVRAAVAILTSSSKGEETAHSARVLRFLGTRDATEAMAKLFSGATQEPGQFDLMLGMYSSPFPDLAVKSMRDEFASARHAIGGAFLDILVRLETDSDAAWTVPPGEQKADDFWKRLEAHRKELMHAEVADLSSAVSRKAGAARAITLNTLLGAASDDPSLVQTLRPALISSWKDLPARTQEEMILYRWEAIDTADMLPILRAIVASPPPAGCMQPDQLRNAALKHIYELDPAEGIALIARDLSNPGANLSLENIRLLSAEQIQTAMPAAVDRIRNYSARRTDYELLDHYGEASVFGTVQGFYEARIGKESCEPQSHVLRFFLRVQPEYGGQQVRIAMAAREDTHCYTSLLQSLGDQVAKAQQSAIEALDDPDPEVQQDAVIALRMWGTAEAEEPMWTRLERFHDEWSGRVSEMRSSPDFRSEDSRAVAFEQALASGIAWAHGWICPPEKLRRLGTLVLTDYDRRQVDIWSEEWKGSTHQITSGWFPPETPTFSVLGYASLTEYQLRAKLEQFPRGTHFDWLIWLPGQSQPPVAVSPPGRSV